MLFENSVYLDLAIISYIITFRLNMPIIRKDSEFIYSEKS